MANVRFEIDGPVAVISIDRPERRNAVDRPTARQLAEAFRRFDADGQLSVAVLNGAGGCFCAGADLRAFGSKQANRLETEGSRHLLDLGGRFRGNRVEHLASRQQAFFQQF